MVCGVYSVVARRSSADTDVIEQLTIVWNGFLNWTFAVMYSSSPSSRARFLLLRFAMMSAELEVVDVVIWTVLCKILCKIAFIIIMWPRLALSTLYALYIVYSLHN